MARIRGRDTRPELIVRRTAHAMGYRFRLHRRDLPGTPDIVFPARRKVIFVHGCFWHRHVGCKRTTTPKSRTDYWSAKFARNVERARRNLAELERKGWEALVLWECETRSPLVVGSTLSEFLGPPGSESGSRPGP